MSTQPDWYFYTPDQLRERTLLPKEQRPKRSKRSVQCAGCLKRIWLEPEDTRKACCSSECSSDYRLARYHLDEKYRHQVIGVADNPRPRKQPREGSKAREALDRIMAKRKASE